MKQSDLAGMRFGRLVAQRSISKQMTSRRRVYWICKCDCGNEAAVQASELRAGTISCGCRRFDGNPKHGAARKANKTSEYVIWCSMKNRCFNPKNKHYKDYGARGITVCEPWRNSFEQFLSEVGKRPSPDRSIDRIDNNRGYEPGNVRWATAKEQAANSRPKKPRKRMDGTVERRP